MTRTMLAALRLGMLAGAGLCAPAHAQSDDPIFASGFERPPPPPGPWTFCADDGAGCRYHGQRYARFGITDHYVYALVYENVTCSTAAFAGQDPAPGQAKHCDYGPLYNPRPGMMGGVGEFVVTPPDAAGHDDLRIQPTSELPDPSGDGVGAFRISCGLSHLSFDDPIVFPGTPGGAHLHAFFGNTGTNAYSTAQTLLAGGNSTCNGGIMNRSAYWAPVIIDAGGLPVIPSDAIFYYKSGYYGVPPALIHAMPPGLRMIAGDGRATAPQDSHYWGCFETYIGHFPEIPDGLLCGVGSHVQLQIDFPQCWNGVDLDSPDHKSHMAFPVEGQCPASHPIAIPVITVNIHYPVPASGTVGWHLSSDMYDYSQHGGYSAHADWFNGWNADLESVWIENCVQAAGDCHAHLLGDGRMFF